MLGDLRLDFCEHLMRKAQLFSCCSHAHQFLAETRPPTPCVVLELDIVRPLRALRASLPAAVIFYAVKANPAEELIFLKAVTAAFGASGPLPAVADPGAAAVAPQDRRDYYPPTLTAMRGSHPGSFEAAHALRDGTFPKSGTTPIDTGEHHDLIVVGGGISGLAAAYFYRAKAGPAARLLLGAVGNTTTTDPRSRRNRVSRRGGQLLTRALSS